MRLLVLAAQVLGCSVDLGIQGRRFACESDAECGLGFTCDEVSRICTRDRVDGGQDSGVPTCGFSDDFGTFDSDRWARNDDTFPLEADGLVQLTSLRMDRRGTLWTRRHHPATRFTFEMAFSIGGGAPIGGDGMALAWIQEEASSVGGRNANLGIYGLNGYLVELDTFTNPSVGDPPGEHLSLARTVGTFLPDAEILATTSTLPVPLRERGEQTVRIEFDLGDVEVYLEDRLVLSARVDDYVPFSATFGATAATGNSIDIHAVHRLTLTCR